MPMMNGGTITNTGNPTGHSHSIEQITDINSGATTGDLLVYSNGVWVPHEATPFVVGVGIYTNAASISTIAANGNAGPYAINYETIFGTPTKFTLIPVLTMSLQGAAGSTNFLVPRATSLSTTGFNLYLYNPRASASGTIGIGDLILHFTAIQIDDVASSGLVSRDPSIGGDVI